MFSVLAASALLPFLPMESVHLILLNLIYDLSCTAIPWDNVDEEFIAVPRKWEASSIGNFMICIGAYEFSLRLDNIRLSVLRFLPDIRFRRRAL